MPGRNQPRSRRGRSAIARTAMNTNSTNGLGINNGGGMKKGGAHPSATGFMRSKPWQISVPASRKNYAFKIKSSTYNNSDNNNDNNDNNNDNNDNNQTHDHNVGSVSPQPPITCISCNFGTGASSGCLISDDINKPTKYCCKKSSWGASGCEDGTVDYVCYDNTAKGSVPQCLSGGRFSNCGDTPPAPPVASLCKNHLYNVTQCASGEIYGYKDPEKAYAPEKFCMCMPKDTTGIKWCTGLSGEISSLAKVSDAQHARIVYSGDSSSDTSKQVPYLCDNSENTSKCSEFSISPDDMDILSNILESGTDPQKKEALNVLNAVAKRYIDVVVVKKMCAPYFYMNSEGPSLQEARGKNNVCIDNQCTSYAIGSDAASHTEIKSTEGCGWWGRGVIQTTGPCNFGKLNASLQSIKEDDDSFKYKDKFNLCKTPDLICNTTKWPELKWIAGFSYWLTDVQSHAAGADHDKDPSWDIADKIKNIDISDTNIYSISDDRIETEASSDNSFNLFVDATSGLVNRGCAKTTCTAGDVHNVKERRKNAIIVKNNFLKAAVAAPATNILELLSNSTSLSDDFTKNILQTLSPGIVQVYTYDAFKSALKIVISTVDGGKGGIDGETFYTGTDLNTSIINISAFLGQCMQETIQYGACDENNWSSGYVDQCGGGGMCGTKHCPYLSVVQIANNMCSCKESIGFTKYPDCTKTTCTTPVNEDECKTKSSCKWYYDKNTDTSSCVQNIYGKPPTAPNLPPKDADDNDYTAVHGYTFYPNTSSCGQLGQDYKKYSCADRSPDECDTTFIDKRIMIATTHAQYYGAAPPLYSDVMGGTIGKQYWKGG
mgnify:CR=1 FL=1